MRVWATLFAGLFLAATATATDFYVSPAGTSHGTGSISQPWDLATALAQPSSVHPGDRIWVRGGTYRGTFNSTLNGSAGAPIVVRQYTGERATIDGNGAGIGGVILNITGSWTWFWGLEVMNSATNRYSPNPSSNGGNGFGVNVLGTNIKCINMVVHDTDQGFGFWQYAQDSELTGNVIYNNGWMGPDRGHGHGIYVQNQTDPRKMIDNIIFNQFSHGVHGYTTGGTLNLLYLEGNISFNNGYLEGTFERNILIGADSGVIAQSPSLISNYTYFTPSRQLGENNIGFSSGCTTATVLNNYFAGGTGLHVTNCTLQSISQNTFYDTVGATRFYAGNTYYTKTSTPSGIQVFVRPNLYEAGRGNIAVYNWSHANYVGVDLSSVVAVGSPYQILDAQNFYGPPIVSGTYPGGLVQIPMTGQVVAQPNGTVPAAPQPTEPEFGAFVILATSGSVAPTVSITAPAASQAVSGTVNVTASASGPSSIANVQFKLDGSNLGSPVTAAPYQLSWNTAGSLNGTHGLSAVATDVSGNTGTAPLVTFTVNNTSSDTTPPTVSLTGLTAGQTVSGSVAVSATASDNIGVAGVQFQVDNVNLGSEKTSAPYAATWDSSTVANGSHTVSAIARDQAGNRTTSSVTVTTSNTTIAPTPAAYWSFNTADISGNLALDRSGNALNATMFNATTTTGIIGQALNFNGANTYVQASGLNLTSNLTLAAWIKTSNTTRTEAVLSKYDSAGTESGYLLKMNPTGKLSMQFGSANMASGYRVADDTRAINDGQWHHAAIVITLGQSVAFYIDGVLNSTSPTKTAAASNGAPFEMGTLPFTYYGALFTGALDEVRVYTQALSALDIAGLAGTSGTADTTPPTVSITAPAANQLVSATVLVTAAANDNVGIASVQFQLDGANLGSPVTSAPYQVSWNTTGATNATHTLSAVALDAANNPGTATGVTVTVNNSVVDTTPPTVSITAPAANQQVSATVLVTASASDNIGVASVQFKLDGANLGSPVTSAPYQVSWNTTGATNATHTLSAVALDAANNPGTAANVQVIVSNSTSSGPNSASFQSTDATTKGSWKGVYGADGFWINSDVNNPPSYAQVSTTGTSYVWSAATQDVKCLQKGASSATDRIASTWYNSSAFTIDVNLTGGAHQVALYVLDWDAANRVERIDVLDAATGLTLDSRAVSSFSSGTYVIWNVTGHVQFRISNVAGPNSIAAGIFFGPGQSGPPTQPMITTNPANASVTAGQTATFTVSATGGGLGYQWQVQPAGSSTFSNLSGATSASFTTPATAAGDNGALYRCVVSNSAGTATSSAATLTVTASTLSSSAAFVTTDTTTRGAWQTKYGSQGYSITSYGSNYPSYAQVNLVGSSTWNNGSTSDPTGLAGVMACWYGGAQFSVDLNLTDSASHQIALYVADWFNGGRIETITISDAATGTVLDTRTASSFLNGQYLIWNIRGHVTITITRNAGPNPVASGLFFQ